VTPACDDPQYDNGKRNDAIEALIDLKSEKATDAFIAVFGMILTRLSDILLRGVEDTFILIVS